MAQPGNSTLKKLRRSWAIFLFFGVVIIGLGYLFLQGDSFAVSWGTIASVFFFYQIAIFYFDLLKNIGKHEKKLNPPFGLGTWLSLVRLLLLSMLAGFLIAPRPEGWLTWAPFTLYLIFNLIDLIDGYAARRWGQVTQLGAKVDLDLDGRGILVGSLLAVLAGTAGSWYLLVGLARYLYVLALWIRRRLGLRVIEKPNPRGRPLAGLQMGVTTALLAPSLHPPFTILISTMVMIPFLGNFLYDWMVIGKALSKQVFLPSWVTKYLPLLLRVFLFALVIYRVISGEVTGYFIFIEAFLAIGIFLGLGVRVLGLLLLVQLGLVLRAQPLGIANLILSLCSLALVYLGPGIVALWQPENSILRRRLGEH